MQASLAHNVEMSSVLHLKGSSVAADVCDFLHVLHLDLQPSGRRLRGIGPPRLLLRLAQELSVGKLAAFTTISAASENDSKGAFP